MSLARLVVTAVRVEGRAKAEVARDYGVSPRWVYELCRRFDREGETGLQPRSRRPHRSPHRTSGLIEDEIVGLRKELANLGVDAGAHTIAAHLERRHGQATVPSVSTIWRILQRRGFVTPQPQKRPRSSFIRFCAQMPNERWQADITHWRLAGGGEVEILNVVDDHSRFLVASDARAVFKAADVVAAFHGAASAHGMPASMLTDNGAVFTAVPRKGRCAIELETAALGIRYVHSSPYHPADLRQGRALPPDAQTVPRSAPSGQHHRGAAGRARPVPRLLQHREAAPGDRATHARRGLRGPAEGGAVASWAAGACPRPGAAGPDRHQGGDHASSQLPAAPHWARPQARRHEGDRVGGWSSGPRHHGGW
jgi:transposase